MTFMNVSGESVAPLAKFYKIPKERILAIFDDLDLPLGKASVYRARLVAVDTI